MGVTSTEHSVTNFRVDMHKFYCKHITMASFEGIGEGAQKSTALA